MSIRRLLTLAPLCLAALSAPALAQTAPVPTITIKTDTVAAKVSPTLYGLMTEEINFSYEGGLYGELIRNRSFKADAKAPAWWSPVGAAKLTLDPATPLNDALNTSLKLDATTASASAPAGIANPGYWGINVTPNTTYRASFYAKGLKGPLTLALQSADGATTLAQATVKAAGGQWKQYEATLTTGAIKPSKDNRFVITTTQPGTVWLQQVSLFPPTYKGHANGNRSDIMQLMADMKPSFLRMPGGNYLEGDTIPERFDWKKTLGDTAKRPGHMSPWKYWSTDGFGLIEYLQWCEDLKMEPVLAIYAGYSLHQDRVAAGEPMKPYVQDALDEIEYVTGDAKTTEWGRKRAQDGHPAPFPLRYVEIGNEDWFDKESTYDARFTQFYDAIKAKYPQLQLISTISPEQPAEKHVHSRTPDVVDQHLYPRSEGEMEARAHEFDALPRTGPKIFVGEWATRIGSPTTNMAAALADAAYMTGMERNADIVVMQSYAPLFTNVSNPKGGRDPNTSMQWPSDLIGYDAQSSYGSPSYYAQAMFSAHHGDEILAAEDKDIPTWTWQPEARTRNGVTEPAKPAQQVPSLFYDVTRDSVSKTLIVKVVNRNATPQPVHIVLQGAATVAATGKAVVLKASSADDTNSIADPRKVVPVEEAVSGLSNDFTHDFPPLSITVLEIPLK
ncbi:alpha-L-arabinofuranosidase C-terminal domain-containing protein [Asticcacaulis solisilvae]|uniref:alpha-L-arabinofuranosidase C-terminal domain-containing protein n=1 Tax=Asticcacaulis solisilvae TaxID=1217274 RepID=UPI003FD8F28E